VPAQGKGDIFLDRQRVVKGRLLKQEPYLFSDFIQLPVIDFCNLLVGNADRTGVGIGRRA
jgi:hypothetical protein